MPHCVSTAFAGRVHVSAWRDAPQPLDIAEIRDELQRELAHRGAPIAMLLVVAPDVPIAGAAARNETIAMLRELGTDLVACAIAIEGRGFRAAAVRAMFSTMALLVRTPFAFAMFEHAHAANEWLCRHIDASPEMVDATLIGLRDHHGCP